MWKKLMWVVSCEKVEIHLAGTIVVVEKLVVAGRCMPLKF
jgi:hypothetical protein